MKKLLSRSSEAYFKNAVPFHGSLLTILSVAFLFMSLAIWLVLLVYFVKIEKLERELMVGQLMFAGCDYKVDILEKKMKGSLELKTPTGTVNMIVPTATEPLVTAPSTASEKSPSGKLLRGSLSPDGTKYAGYEEATKGKIGIAVEIVSTGKIRYIVIFNPNTESTGAGTIAGSGMSVRWVDDRTIEYDVLVNKNGGQIKDTERVAIFF